MTGVVGVTGAAGAAGIILEARNIYKSFIGGDGSTLHILNDLNLSVARGEMVAIVGASGSGKSTLLHILGALDTPDQGDVIVAGQSLQGNSEADIAELRNKTIGFVFQFHHLLREFTALENVMMPLRISGASDRLARAKAQDLLSRVGLVARMHHRPSQLSGGEQQRTAVARALAMEPAVLLADEPSGNLDHNNGELLHDLLVHTANDLSVGLVVVTHNASLAARANRSLLLEDGKLH